MAIERFVPQGEATRNVALTCHFSRFIPSPLPTPFISLTSISNSTWACRLYCMCIVTNARYKRDTHANARETATERYVVQAQTYQIKKEKVDSLPVENVRIFMRKLVTRLIKDCLLSWHNKKQSDKT